MTYEGTRPPTISIRERGEIIADIVKKGWNPVYIGPVAPGDQHTLPTAVTITIDQDNLSWKGADNQYIYQVHTAAKHEKVGWQFTWGKYDLNAAGSLQAALDKTHA